MANQFYITAGIPSIDNSSGATSNSFYISAGLIPDDIAVPSVGFTGKINGISVFNITKINGISITNIGKIDGISFE